MISFNLRKIINSYSNYNLSKNDFLDREIHKIRYQKDPKKRLFMVNKLYDRDPLNHRILGIMCSIYHYFGKVEQFQIFKEYHSALKVFKKNNPINIFFIPRQTLFGAFGNYYYLDLLIRAIKNKLIENNQLFIIKSAEDSHSNKDLYDYFSDYLNIVDLKIYKKIEENFLIPFGVCFPFIDNCLYLDLAANYIEKQSKDKIQLKLTTKHEDIGQRYLKKIGLKDTDWFVTLHVRESSKKDNKQYGDDFRNSDPFNYLEAVKFIISQGGHVFRMGDASLTKLPNINGLIDYAHSEDKNSALDIYLAAKSKFCLGTSSGYFRVPGYFDVPVILTNQSQTIEYFSLRKHDIFLPKNIKFENKQLTLEEMFNFEVAFFSSTQRFKKHKFEVTENTSTQICDAVKVMMDLNVFNEMDSKLIIEKKAHSSIYGESKPKAYSKIIGNYSH